MPSGDYAVTEITTECTCEGNPKSLTACAVILAEMDTQPLRMWITLDKTDCEGPPPETHVYRS